MILLDHLAHTSRWRRLPMGEKAVLCLGLLALSLASPGWEVSFGLLSLSSLLAWRSGCRSPDWLRLLAIPAAFVLTGAFALLLGWENLHPTIQLSQFPAALHLVARCLAAAAALLLLAVTTPAHDLVHGLRRCGLPPELAELALLIYRFLFLFHHTALTMQASQHSRLGLASPRQRIRALGLLVASLLPRTLDHARRLEIGLAARGFDGSFPTLSQRPPSRPGVLLGLCLLFVLAGGFLWWQS